MYWMKKAVIFLELCFHFTGTFDLIATKSSQGFYSWICESLIFVPCQKWASFLFKIFVSTVPDQKTFKTQDVICH